MAPRPLEYESTDSSWTVEFISKSYDERGVKGAEPTRRWLSLVASSSSSKWHIKVAFHGTVYSGGFPKRTKRRNDLENLCLCINFKQLSLFKNTVTELLITHDTNTKGCRLPLVILHDAENGFASSARFLRAFMREDPLRVRFPPYRSDGGSPAEELSHIVKMQELEAGVHKVRVGNNESFSIYKEIDRPLYVPQDSEVLEQELRNLQLFRSTEGIAQLVAAVVSENPYKTTNEQDSIRVLRGVLIEYYPNGTLKDALRSPRPQMDGRWLVWGLQIAKALACLHEKGVTHMDLKPSNVVINAEWSAVVIDISGIGGVTPEWLSPRLRKKANPLIQSFETRKQNDIWALGKILFTIAKASKNVVDKELLESVAWAAIQVPVCISLDDIIRRLSRVVSEKCPPKKDP
ncbi:kinase-like domain-containing protein [Nemania sp. FL0031]|nr:kinase-like domain-containing protein [Nemania sp. FL0031]